MMDTTEADHGEAFASSECCNLSGPERQEMRRQYDWYRKRNKGRGQAITSARRTRPLITLSGMENEVFFDTTVEILKVWNRSRPFQMYVTDYTSHPLIHAANDVNLGILSREELLAEQEACGDAGNGRVLAIGLWDDQEEIVNHVNVGMVVRLENIRAKMQPNNFLNGTMGGGVQSREEKLRVVVVKDEDILKELERRKEDYFDLVAFKRAERLTETRSDSAARPSDHGGDGEEEEEGKGGEADRSPSRLSASADIMLSFPTNMPPPGQRPLAAIENDSNQRSQASSMERAEEEKRPSHQETALTLLEESLASYPITNFDRLTHLTAEQLNQQKVYVCEVKVVAMDPKTVDKIVEVICGLCKKV